MNSRFVSIDIETTGLDPETCDVIEIGAVIDDWLVPIETQPTFHTYIKRDQYKGQSFALSMHPTIFRRIATQEEGYQYLYPNEAIVKLGLWMKGNGAYIPDPEYPEREARAVVAGKNFASFDDPFLRKLSNSFDEYVKYHHRIIDPAMLYWNPLTDTKPPGLKTCLERAGLPSEVTHNAVDDAKQVVDVIHVAVGRKCSPEGLLEVINGRKS